MPYFNLTQYNVIYFNLIENSLTYFNLNQPDLIVGRGGALVESKTFDQKVVGSNPALAATYTDFGQVFHSPAALWREIPAQYPCCVGSASK